MANLHVLGPIFSNGQDWVWHDGTRWYEAVACDDCGSRILIVGVWDPWPSMPFFVLPNLDLTNKVNLSRTEAGRIMRGECRNGCIICQLCNDRGQIKSFGNISLQSSWRGFPETDISFIFPPLSASFLTSCRFPLHKQSVVHFEQMWLHRWATPPIFPSSQLAWLSLVSCFCSFHPNSLVFSVFPGRTGYAALDKWNCRIYRLSRLTPAQTMQPHGRKISRSKGD